MVEALLMGLVGAVIGCALALDKIERHLRRLTYIEDRRFGREIERGDYDSQNY